jgi:hypothetical protein
MADVRVAGTAIICIVAAFGAAFLVARAVKHEAPAHAATPLRTTRVAARVTERTTASRVNAELVSQFTPVQASLRRRPKPHHRHHRQPPANPVPVVTTASPTPAPTVTVTSTPVYSAPVQSAPPPPPPSQPATSGSTTHKKKQSTGGSGTTTIGG